MKSTRKMLTSVLFLTIAAGASGATAAEMSGAVMARADIQKTFGFVPGFMKMTPDLALPGAWMEMKSLWLNPQTALPGKLKELIGLAVAARSEEHTSELQSLSH